MTELWQSRVQALEQAFSHIANTRMREVMLPVLQFPASVPAFIAGIEGTTGALRGEPIAVYADWVNLLVAFCIIFLVLSYLLFEYVLEE